jgi:hypothetical protein
MLPVADMPWHMCFMVHEFSQLRRVKLSFFVCVALQIYLAGVDIDAATSCAPRPTGSKPISYCDDTKLPVEANSGGVWNWLKDAWSNTWRSGKLLPADGHLANSHSINKKTGKMVPGVWHGRHPIATHWEMEPPHGSSYFWYHRCYPVSFLNLRGRAYPFLFSQ